MQCIAPLTTIVPITEDVVEFTFNIAGTDFRYQPGQYVTLTLSALQDQPIPIKSHDFSIASSPHDITNLQIVVRRSGSPFKTALWALSPGDTVLLSGPKGVMTLPETAQEPVICIAAGIGITPFLSMLRYASRVRSGHRITMYYCLPSPRTVLYRDELERLALQQPGIMAHMLFGRSQLEQALPPIIDTADAQSLWYLAGPPTMVTVLRRLLRTGGIIDNQVRWEGFTGYGKQVY